jgi:ATP-dependent DNA ligase
MSLRSYAFFTVHRFGRTRPAAQSGYALRFPRIVRLGPDKSPEEADTIERAREIYEKQAGS